MKMIEENTPDFDVEETVRFTDPVMDHSGETCTVLKNDLGADLEGEPVYNIKFEDGHVLKGIPESCLEKV